MKAFIIDRIANSCDYIGGNRMKVYSLSGPSGTGKSTAALEVAYMHQIEGIIDDGLFIVNGQKCAGISAKFEKNSFTAVRRAIFQEQQHRTDVIEAIKDSGINSILVVGTSDKMTKQIASRLELGEIDTYIYVNDIRTAKEIRQAQFIRQMQGTHVMPIPHAQVEQNFFKRFVQKGRDIFLNKKKIGETTIVQPDFQQERIYIARLVYLHVLQHTLNHHKQIAKYEVQNLQVSTIPEMNIVIYLKSPVHYDVVNYLNQLQQDIADTFLHHFGIEPERIDLQLKGIK